MSNEFVDSNTILNIQHTGVCAISFTPDDRKHRGG